MTWVFGKGVAASPSKWAIARAPQPSTIKSMKLRLLLLICLLALACQGAPAQATPAGITSAPGTSAPAAPSATPALAGAAGIANCPLFPADNIWNTRIDHLPAHPNSDAYINFIGRYENMHPDFGAGEWDGGPIGIPYNLVPGDQPRVPVSFYYPTESDPGPYPIPPNPLIEGGPDADGDRHILVVDTDNCVLYEVFDAYPEGGGWEAGSGAIFDLHSHALRPATWTSADAAGLPILAGLVRYDEVASGAINHALRFTAEVTAESYIWPARHEAGASNHPYAPPMGLRVRMKADYDISGFSPEVQIILTALKRYGMILADNGSPWYLSGVPDERWTNDDLVPEFHSIPGDAFEVVDVSGLMIHPDSGQARQTIAARLILTLVVREDG